MIEKFKNFNGRKVNENLNLNDLVDDIMNRFEKYTSDKKSLEIATKNVIELLDDIKKYPKDIQDLNLDGLGLHDIPDLSDLIGDVELNIYANNNKLTNFDFAVNYKKINQLLLCNNDIRDVKSLAKIKCDCLSVLELSDNKIKDLTPFESKKHNLELYSLGLNNNKITDLSPLGGYGFFGLHLRDNLIDDISCIYTGNLLTLDIVHNKISNLKPLLINHKRDNSGLNLTVYCGNNNFTKTHINSLGEYPDIRFVF